MMKIKHLSFLWLFTLVSSCYIPPTQIIPAGTAASTPVSANPTSQSSAVPDVESSKVSALQQNSLCPSNREVSLSQLGLLPQMNLVVLPLDAVTWGDVNIAYSILSPDSPEPESIANIAPPPGWMNRNYSISPDGKWISFVRWEINNFANRELLVSSLDGSRQITVMKLPDIFTHSKWLSDNKLAIIGVSDSSNQDPLSYLYIPLKIIDPFTLEEQLLSPLPDEDIGRSQMFVMTDNQNFYNLYSFGQSPFEKFILYDYANNTSHNVFQWLTNKDDLSAINTRFFYENGAFSIVLTKSDGLDIALGLDWDAIKSPTGYEKVMQNVVLPKGLLPSTAYAWIYQTNTLLLTNTNEDIDNPKPLEIYSLNYEQKVLNRYCLTIFPNLEGIFPSPDGHFAAFSYQTSDALKSRITILNLDNGFISVVEDLHMIGWGLK
jgi:hypothetical protein